MANVTLCLCLSTSACLDVCMSVSFCFSALQVKYECLSASRFCLIMSIFYMSVCLEMLIGKRYCPEVGFSMYGKLNSQNDSLNNNYIIEWNNCSYTVSSWVKGDFDEKVLIKVKQVGDDIVKWLRFFPRFKQVFIYSQRNLIAILEKQLRYSVEVFFFFIFSSYRNLDCKTRSVVRDLELISYLECFLCALQTSLIIDTSSLSLKGKWQKTSTGLQLVFHFN